MSFIKVWTKAKGWLATFLTEQAEMSAKAELFLEELPWRTKT